MVYILGDVIDRHPDGIKILKYIMKKANIRMLLGNHEYMMLNTLCKQTANGTNYYRAKRLWMKNGGKVTLDAFIRCHAETQEAILSFLKSLPLASVLERKQYESTQSAREDEPTSVGVVICHRKGVVGHAV